MGEARQRPVASAVTRSLRRPRDLFAERACRLGCQPIDIEPNERPCEQRQVGEPPQLVTIRGHTGPHRVAAVVFRRPVVAPGDPDTRGQPPQVPLPAAWVGLVEIVEVDHQIPLGRCVEPEVAEVRVAAHHGCDSRCRQMRDVLGHHHRGSAQKSVRRVDHATDPDRDQPVDPPLVTDVDEFHRVGTARRRRPVG